MSDQYILGEDGRTPERCDDNLTWARWFATAQRVVAKTDVDHLCVSTVFLGIDHSFGRGPPLLFETMIFGDDEGYQDRCSTWEEAEEMHARAVAVAEREKAKKDTLTDEERAKLHRQPERSREQFDRGEGVHAEEVLDMLHKKPSGHE